MDSGSVHQKHYQSRKQLEGKNVCTHEDDDITVFESFLFDINYQVLYFRLAKDVAEATYILGHSVQHDTEYLKNIGVDHIALGKEMFDTQVINIYKESLKDRDNFRTRGLIQLMKENKIEYREEDLHNAGCDAFYTMMLFLRQMNFTEEQVNAIIMSF